MVTGRSTLSLSQCQWHSSIRPATTIPACTGSFVAGLRVDSAAISDLLALESRGRLVEAGQGLLRLAARGHPVGLLELSRRYLLDPQRETNRFAPGIDVEKSKVLADEAVQTLAELADCGDAEAMRYLGRVYLGDFGPWFDSAETAEDWLIKSFHAGCQAAAADLHRFYLCRDQRKADRWYQEMQAS